MQADELEGLHAELELSLVGRGMDFNSRVHITPSQSKPNIRNIASVTLCITMDAIIEEEVLFYWRYLHDKDKECG